MEVNSRYEVNYFESLNWIEVSMTKALKMWANNQRSLKCVVGNCFYFYHGQSAMKVLNHNQVQRGKWFIEAIEK